MGREKGQKGAGPKTWSPSNVAVFAFSRYELLYKCNKNRRKHCEENSEHSLIMIFPFDLRPINTPSVKRH
jgi:hypothetical protein